jgi:hypothetical protein
LDAPLKALEKNSTVAMPAKTISAWERYHRTAACQPAEDDCEDHHHQEWSDQRPGDADHGLLVAHRNIALP